VNRRLLLAPALVAGLAASSSAAPPPPGAGVIDVRAVRPPGVSTFESQWSTFRKADARGDQEAAQNAMKEIRRLRVERNIRSLTEYALARVGDGLDHLRNDRISDSEARFRDAVVLDPHLPDAHFALATAAMKRGPVGVVTAVRETLAGAAAPLGTARGRHTLASLAATIALVAAFVTLVVFGLIVLVRHATLLVHDLDEAFGQRHALAVGLGTALLLLPAITFQGWGWLPLWWLALLFIYMSTAERVVAGLVAVASILVGPTVARLDARHVTMENPVFRAGLAAYEGGPDQRAVADLEAAIKAYPDDRDLEYLLARMYKKGGRYDDAASLYRQILEEQPKDLIALNNLANIEFSNQEFAAAIARYKQGIESSPPPTTAATLYYNLSLAHYQRFEYQPAQEARSQADRLAGNLVAEYDELWKHENQTAVVDLSLTDAELWAKAGGRREGVGLQNVAGKAPDAPVVDTRRAVMNRFTGFPLVLAAVAFGLGRMRGARAFTTRCLKCGTPFCRKCHLGAATSGLCSQCHHLFVVRDGVSGPARNQKLLEVQKEDETRERIFRALSLLVPGSGHLYAQRTLLGVLFVALWALVLSAALLAGRVLPFTEAPSEVVRPWGLGLAAVILLVVYVLANRSSPDFEVTIPARRPPTQRRRAA
jgi:tetratricopeptide (TPR) repeat protein